MPRKYAKGSRAWFICQRCGQRGLYRDSLFDGYFPNLRVHPECWEDKHPQENLPKVSDPIALWRPSTEYGGAGSVLTANLVIEPATLAMGGTIVFQAGPLIGSGGSNQGGVLTFSTNDWLGAPTHQDPSGTVISGELAEYGDFGIATFTASGNEFSICLRIPAAEVRPSPQTAYWSTVEIPGIQTTLSSGTMIFTTDTSEPGFIRYEWGWGGNNLMVPGNTYTATFLPNIPASQGNRVELSWTEAEIFNARFESYDVYRAIVDPETGEPGDYVLLVSLPITYDEFMEIETQTLEYVDTNIDYGTTYAYKVIANAAN